MKIQALIKEEIYKYLTENEHDDIDWDLYEMMDDVLHDVISDYKDALEKGGGKQPWKVVPFPRLKKIWEDYIRHGVVRDTKGLDMIEKIFTENVLKLKANNELSGREPYFPDEIENYDLTEDDFWGNDNFDFGDFIGDKTSDYGLNPLLNLVDKLRKTNDYEKKLPILDKMLNVVHMNSDLASLFIQGGSSSLNKISGYSDKEDLGQTQVYRPM
ncbi:MAG: hypothetical protein ACOC2U_01255 [bacterium]